MKGAKDRREYGTRRGERVREKDDGHKTERKEVEERVGRDRGKNESHEKM